MDKNWIYVAYYVYAIFIICLFSYAVFWLDKSGWWFLLAVVLLDIQPKSS